MLVESHLRYADVIWGSVSNSKMESLQRFQDRSISIIDTTRIKDDWSKNFLQVKKLITFDRSVMTYKIMNRLCPENLWNKFQRRSHYFNYSYNTRFCENLQIPKLKFFDQSSFIAAVSIIEMALFVLGYKLPFKGSVQW